MSRDYKNSGTRKGGEAKGKGAPAWLWLVTGLSLGLLLAGLVYLGSSRPSRQAETPAVKPVEKPPEKKVEPKPRKVEEPKPEKRAEPVKPRFEFYTILPEVEVVVPEQELAPKSKPDGVATVKQPGTYILQAGSFKTSDQADQLKARIVLLGLPAEIQAVTINDKETWHRVRVGPFAELNALNEARDRLKQEGVDTLLLRIKPEEG